MDTADLVAIIVALASFVVSWAALYATALKKAEIGLHYTRLSGEWAVSGWSGMTPSGEIYVTVAVYANNSGANAGILEAVTVTAPDTLGGVLSQPMAWYPAKTGRDTHPSNYAASFPRAVDAGEIEELYLIGKARLSLSPIERLHAAPDEDREREAAFARRLHEAKTLPITVTWRYARPAGRLGGQPPESVEKSAVFEIAADELRDQCVRFWRGHAQQYGEHATRLASIAETGT